MKKALFGIFLAIGLVFCVTPTVFAEDWNIVSTNADLLTQLAAGGNIKLGADLTLEDDVSTTSDTALDLNGHTMSTGLMSILAKSKLRIIDSTTSKTGLISSGDEMFPIYAHENGDVTFESGKIESIYGIVVTRSTAKLQITGGEINTEQFGVYAVAGETEISGGKITGGMHTATDLAPLIGVEGSATKLTISGGEIITQYYGVEVSGDAAFTMNGGKIDGGEFGVTVWNDSVVIINGGEIVAHSDTAVSTNGTTASPQITINGGTLTSENGLGIYAPAGENSKTTINGGTITGKEAAIEIRAGELEINGGEMTSTATEYKVVKNGNGSTTTGAAVAIAQHNTKHPIKVTICGGKFTGFVALSEGNPQENDATALSQMTLEIAEPCGDNEPEFISTNPANNADVIKIEDINILTKFAKSGRYSHKVPADFIADGYVEPNEKENGMYYVTRPHDVTVDAATNGTVSASKATAMKGEEVEITTTPASGYELDAITVKDADGNAITVTDGKFTMPAKDVKITVTFKEIPAEPTPAEPTPAEPTEPEEKPENPATYDDIAVYFVIMGASLGGLAAVAITKKFF